MWRRGRRSLSRDCIRMAFSTNRPAHPARIQSLTTLSTTQPRGPMSPRRPNSTPCENHLSIQPREPEQTVRSAWRPTTRSAAIWTFYRMQLRQMLRQLLWLDPLPPPPPPTPWSVFGMRWVIGRLLRGATSSTTSPAMQNSATRFLIQDTAGETHLDKPSLPRFD